jgi:hypothetical protein
VVGVCAENLIFDQEILSPIEMAQKLCGSKDCDQE